MPFALISSVTKQQLQKPTQRIPTRHASLSNAQLLAEYFAAIGYPFFSLCYPCWHLYLAPFLFFGSLHITYFPESAYGSGSQSSQFIQDLLSFLKKNSSFPSGTLNVSTCTSNGSFVFIFLEASINSVSYMPCAYLQG